MSIPLLLNALLNLDFPKHALKDLENRRKVLGPTRLLLPSIMRLQYPTSTANKRASYTIRPKDIVEVLCHRKCDHVSIAKLYFYSFLTNICRARSFLSVGERIQSFHVRLALSSPGTRFLSLTTVCTIFSCIWRQSLLRKLITLRLRLTVKMKDCLFPENGNCQVIRRHVMSTAS